MDQAVVGDEVSLRNKEDFFQMNLQSQSIILTQNTEVPVQGLCLRVFLQNPVECQLEIFNVTDNVSQAMYPL